MTQRASTRWLLSGGVIGPALLVVLCVIEGAIRPDYDPMRVFVSQLSLGDQGWLQIANFVVSGLLIVAFAVGLRRVVPSGRASRWGPILLGLVGLGLIVSGVFVTDPALGYPPGTPPGLTQNPSWHGSLHLLGALFVFGGLSITSFVFARRFQAQTDRRWARYSVATGIGMLAVFVAANLGASGVAGLGDIAGALQRVAILIGFGWIAALAARLAAAPGH
jgi:Protein of unknown function (DUF998)